LPELKLENKVFTFLIFGGSLGAVKLNEVACDTFLDLSIKDKFQILHITGRKSYNEIQKKVKTNKSYRIFEYMHNIANAYAASDIIICRSGAGSVFEIKVLDKPAILVPYPYATDNHQYWNAKEVEQDGKIVIIEEKNLTKENLTNAIYTLIKNRVANNKAVNNAVKFPQELIFKEIIKCIKS
jgi:UDP-N-acetylglucosamine--N-acetylmuramyl-(pentapeptide) pyrophosphoryl-undecaprenol N-acetylglucosamine transferase